MSSSPLASCLICCLLTLVPAAATRADDGGPSARRKAEMDALSARRHTEKRVRARAAAARAAETARQLYEIQAYEINLAQSFAAYQMSVERQAMMQRCRQSTSPQPYWTPSTGAAILGIPLYTPAPVFVNFNPQGPASGAGHEPPAHATATPHSQTAAHHGHGR